MALKWTLLGWVFLVVSGAATLRWPADEEVIVVSSMSLCEATGRPAL